jgi:NAD(P)-dependent dehydrogenase (short-subunit alcohol dehydrogenase family)
VVRALAAAGAWVAAGGRDPARLEALREVAGDVRAADLSTAASAAAWAEAIGPVDGLVHLVGGWRGGAVLEELDLADLELLETQLFHTVVHATRAFAPTLKAAGARGRCALVSSSVVGRPTPGNAAYAATKAAAEAWMLTLASELAPSGGTANVVVVDAIATPAMRAEHPGQDDTGLTDADDIAAALAYLCSDAARAMNGQRLRLHSRA